MRTQLDRLRHTILFEVIGLALNIPVASWLLNTEPAKIGVFSVCMSLLAMFWNWAYNLLFDIALVRTGRSLTDRSPMLRAFHAILFEASLLCIALPGIAWWLNLTLLEAFITDIGFATFYVIYAYIYNWGYDRVFPYSEDPVPATAEA